MKELQYPFDSDYILKKKKRIRKELLSEKRKRIKKKIAICGGSTTNDIKMILELFLLDYDIEPEFYESEYNQYYQDIMFDNPELVQFEPDIIYIHTSIHNISEFPNITMGSEEIGIMMGDKCSSVLDWDK